jgi:EmrB/QacA subfamily drug resistance transporter
MISKMNQDTKTEADHPAPERIDPVIWRVVAVVIWGPLMTLMDSTVVTVSLSTISRELKVSIGQTQWIVSGYLLALALILPLNAWIVDRLGAKRLYLGCFSTFTLASVLCGASTTINQLIVARVVQGMAGGLLAPMAQMMLAKVAGKQMARVIGYAAVPVLIAPILGPVVAGLILKYASWPWLFYVNLPIGFLAVLLAFFLLPADDKVVTTRPFDFPGFLLISPGLVLFLSGMDNVQSVRGRCLFFIGLALLAIFVWRSLRKRNVALIDLYLFKIRIFSVGIITQFLANGASYAGQMLIPLFLMEGYKFPETQAGWMLMPTGIGMMVTYLIMGTLTDRFGCRAVSVSGILLTTAGTTAFVWMIYYGFSIPLLVVALVLRGVGQAAIGVPSVSAVYGSVPKEKLGYAAVTANIAQRLGAPIATTLIAMVISFSIAHVRIFGPQVFLTPFLFLIGLQLIQLISASGLPVRVSVD